MGKHDSMMRELRQSDFDSKEKYWTRFPPEGSKSTPPHQSVDFKWKDYCPMVFRYLLSLTLLSLCVALLFAPKKKSSAPKRQRLEYMSDLIYYGGDWFCLVFRHLRELFAIDPADYMVAICGNDALREFSSPGKSGSFFYLTQDERFMIKTVKKSEVKVS